MSSAGEADKDHPPKKRQRLRGRTACLPCRLSKTSCDGNEPCGRCARQEVMCVSTVDGRKTANRNANQGKRRGTEAAAEESNLLKQEVHSSVSGSAASTTSPMHLFYGPSSHFVFLQHLHRFLSDTHSAGGSTGSNRNRDTIAAVREFGYTNIFFGTDSNLNPTGDGSADLSLEALPFEVAGTFLEMYISSVHVLYPICEEPVIRGLLCNFYSNYENRLPISRDGTLVIAFMAIGATLTEQSMWAESLYRHAKSNIDSWGDSVSLRSVQILLLLSEYLQICARPNSAWLTARAAADKAIAVGLHQGTNPSFSRTKPSSPCEMAREKERVATFWSLYALERNQSLTSGRPASFNDLDIDVPEPAFDKFLQASVRLARISSKVYYGIYGRRLGSSGAYCQKIKDLYEELLDYHANLHPDIRFPLRTEELRPNFPIMILIMTFNFFQVMAATLRPCLIFDTVRRRQLAKKKDQKPIIPDEWVPVISDMLAFGRDLNAHVIHVFNLAAKANPISSRLRHARFFIEIACFTLLFDVVRDPLMPESDSNLRAVEEGIEAYLRTPVDRTLLVTTQAASRLLKLTKDMVAAARGEPVPAVDVSTPISMPAQSPAFATQFSAAETEGFAAGGNLDAYSDSPNSLFSLSSELLSGDLFDTSYYLWSDTQLAGQTFPSQDRALNS